MLPKTLVILLIALLAILGCTTANDPLAVPTSIEVPSPTAPAPTVKPTPTAGVTPTPEERPTATLPPPSPTSEPTAAPAPVDWQGNPLQPHTWTVGPVLLRYDDAVCVDDCQNYFSPFPRFILYSDGRLITMEYDDQTYQPVVKQTLLSRRDMCTILNTFDAIGYFGYDSTAYFNLSREYPRLVGWGLIEANSWNPTELNIGGVSDLLGRVPLDPPLVMTYHLIKALKEELKERPGSEIYRPNEIGLLMIERAAEHIDEFREWYGDIDEWSLEEIKLADLHDRATPYSMWTDDPYATPSPQEPPAVRVMLSGQDANSLLALFGDAPYPWPRHFEEDGRYYTVAIRATLPYETVHGIGGEDDKSVIPGPDTVYPVTSFTCTPEDGVLDVYEQLLRIGQ